MTYRQHLTLVPPLPPEPTFDEAVQQALEVVEKWAEKLPRLLDELEANNAKMRVLNDRMLGRVEGG